MTQHADFINVFLDFETYYDRQYSLSKMPTITYVRDPRFKFLGCSVAVESGPITYYDNEEEFQAWAATIDWRNVRMIAHNNLFDGTVLTQRYGIFPARYGCTLSMSRPLLPLDSFALKNVAPLLGLGEKGDALVEGSTDGAALKDYANNDLKLCRDIYYMLRQFIPDDEMELISMTVRMGAEPTFVADLPLLKEVHRQFSTERTQLIADSGYTEAQLTSNPQFAQIIRDLGLNVPRKISVTTEEETDALGKNDPEFQELMAEYPEYGPIWEARLAAKSNINIKRTEKFIEIAELGGTLPMPYNYCGAGTTRWSGADKLNVQNLVRLDKSKMRNAFKAPKGYVVVAVDSSAIELRVNMWWSGQWDKVSVLAQPNPIIYELEAAEQLNKPVGEVTKKERQFGKVIQLGCGFDMGAPKFRHTCASGPMGMDPIYISDERAAQVIRNYRSNNSEVPASWGRMGTLIGQMYLGPKEPTTYRCISIHKDALMLPSGLMLRYPGLHFDDAGDGWIYGVGKKITRLYGGKLQENIVQGLARVIIGEQALRIDQRYRVLGLTHDEVIYIAPIAEAEEAVQFGIDVLSTSPTWAPDLPLAAEGEFAPYYNK